jgi:hypothetical protein
LFCSSVWSQQTFTIVSLDNSLNESSGLVFLNQKIITHNDSQGAPALYEMDSLTGQKSRTVVIANTNNTDWEDIAYDDNYIYIGDFGNNAGNRTDLKIYRINQIEYWNTPNDTVFADTIQFSYAAQSDFTAQQNATNWDCEAMTIIGDSIYLFSKNWINQKTYVYTFPKSLGNYSITAKDSLPVQGLITSADFNTISNRLVLTGNTPFSPFIVEMDWNNSTPISQLNMNRYSISVNNSIQVEAITHISENEYYLTSEYFSGNSAELMRLKGKNGSLTLEENKERKSIVFPNPSDGIIHIQCENFQYFTVNTLEGRLVYQSENNLADLSFLESGNYRIEMVHTDNSITQFRFFKN